MNFALLGLGTAVPPGTVHAAEAAAVARAMSGDVLRNAAWLEGVYSQSGVSTRHQVHGRELVRDLLETTRHSGSPFLPDGARPDGPTTAERMRQYDRFAGPLAVEAAAAALREAEIPAAAVTHLVTVSCTGFAAPGVDLALVRGLGLSPRVLRTHVGYMGCHGAINGLRVADAYCADPAAVVLLAAVELCSLHYYYGPAADKVVANALFADGAAAVVGRAGVAPWHVAATGSTYLPDSAAAMGWHVGDHGFTMTLARTIPRQISAHLRGWLAEWLAAESLTVEDVACWAVHPGGPRILDAVQESLGLPAVALAASRGVLHDFGNMSSPTVLFVLRELRRRGLTPPCVVLGFGPGLVAEAVLLR